MIQIPPSCKFFCPAIFTSVITKTIMFCLYSSVIFYSMKWLTGTGEKFKA